MSGNEELKAAVVTAPQGDGTNNTNVVALSVSTTATYVAVPADWHGRWIQVKLVTANASVFFSEQVATLPDISKVAADKQLGWYIAAGETEQYKCPELSDRQATLYLCADADASGTLYARAASPK